MAIKARQKAIVITFVMISGLTIGVLTLKDRFNFETESHADLNLLSAPKTSSEEILVDKVFTFLAPSDTKQFNDLYLLENLNYYVLLEIVTPHNCKINVSIIDPELDTYDIFQTEVNVSQGDQWFEVPFGTAISGNYTFIFSVITALNLNVYIKIHFDREDKCLYDIMAPEYLNNMELYRVNKFFDGTMIEHNVMLKTDVSYKFYIGRVSAIGGSLIDGEVRVDYDLTDPQDIEFIIYRNKTAESVGSVLHFNFGTAIGGIYTVEITIFCRIDVVNVAYAIAEDHSISTIKNGTTPDPPPNNGTTSGFFYMPMEWIIGFGICAGGILGLLVVIGSVRRKRNSVSLRNS
ncbi:MAG: hypothetical protein HWN79_02955 [Candidatus Lokiarchaeota archaeon]|nr:hypothetical protein [Candidatus Lokiarchaeota archaeon]